MWNGEHWFEKQTRLSTALQYACLACCLLFFLTMPAWGQDKHALDSLMAKLRDARNDTQRVDLYNELIFEYRYSNPEMAMRYSRDALALAQHLNYKKGEAGAYAETGNIDRYQGRYMQAMEYYMQALAISEEIKDTHGIAHAYDLIGGIVRIQGNNKKAEQYYLQALPMWQKLNDQKGVFSAYISLGVIQRSLGMTDKAMLYFEDALTMAKRMGYKQGQAIALNCLGQGKQSQRNYAAAMEYFSQSLELKKQISDRRGQAITLNDMANVHLALRSYGPALQCAQQAVTMAASIEVKDELRDAYQTLYAVHAAMGNNVLALRYHEMFVALKDSLLNSENSRRLSGLESAYQLQKKQTEIESLRKEKEIQTLTIRWQSVLLAALALVAVLLGIVGWVARRAYLQKRADNKLLQAQRTEIEDKNTQLNNTLEELRSTQEQLILTEKTVALGKLVANVAHEINTPLGVIRAQVGKLSAHLPQLLEEIPGFVAKLQPAESEQFKLLLKQSNEVDLANISTREERQVRSALKAQLEAAGVPYAEERAELLLGAGVRSLAPVASLLQSPHIEDMLRMATRIKQLRTNMADVSIATDKTRKVVYALQTYATEGRRTFEEKVHLRDSIEKVLALYGSHLRKNITVKADWQSDLTIPGDGSELEQVWTQIVFNAIQAMEGKPGTLHIGQKVAGDYVRITFTDSGTGIAPDVLPRIFEPFFTARPNGEGSGLGLYVSRKIVENHAGSIQVESEPGRTRFAILLPINPNLPKLDARADTEA
jgi:signal transduction histidine kinase